MTPLETALAAWIAFHTELGVDMNTYLLPPATEAEIVAVEEQIGYRLPEDLRELYKIANGQWSLFDDDEALSNVSSDQRWAPMFGYYEFLPLHKALREYEIYLDIYTSDKEFNTKYYQANPDETYEPVKWEVRKGDLVDELGWNPSWFTFAGANANYYSVDMAPPHGVAPGQVVLHGADEHVLQVVGSSVTDMMQQAVTHLKLSDVHRFQFEQAEGTYPAHVYFNMDWRARIPQPSDYSQLPAAYTAWEEEQEQQFALKEEQVRSWLQGRNISVQDSSSIVQWLNQYFLRDMSMMTPSMSVIMAMQKQRISDGQLPKLGEMAIGVASLVTRDGPKEQLRQHAVSMASAHFSHNGLRDGLGISVTSEDMIDLYHQYKLDMGEWTQAQFDKVQTVYAELKKLEINTESVFSMTSSSNVLTLCTSTFDEETYKSEETCHDIDLSLF